MTTPARIVVAIALLGGGVTHARAQDSTSTSPADTSRATLLPPIEVVGRVDDLHGVALTASEGHVGAADLRLRPLLREGELLETVPGVIVTQHSGDGKANQYFVRGFNLDHGTDFQTTLEGMPVNLPSNAHGQGYTDLNFLIPELVEYLDYRMGVYYPDLGDFGSAGGADFHLVHRLAQPFVTAGGGTDGLRRVAAGGSAQVGSGTLLLAGEGKVYDGPWDLAEDLRKVSGVARYSWEKGASAFSVLAMAYHNTWNASDQIPERAVENGRISRFGEIDSTDGGTTERFSLSGTWRHTGEQSVEEVTLYGIYSQLSLFSNFTFFLDDPVHGDQFNQREHRTVLGGSATHAQAAQALGADHVIKIGVQSRADLINGLGLYHTEARTVLAAVRVDDVREWGSGVWIQAE
ncbi:MAG TPA: TonB-dependent receptor plug domain-containing protein, partial [Gemmatimonadales bacterium]|nr:TonB-dependent receptor plug domain-containing protein [Gemmatimonadales bacterium]